MRMSRSASCRAVTLTIFLGLLGAALSGCASKNPLMDDAPVTRAPQAEPAVAAASVAAPPSASTASAAIANSGVQTIHTKRFLGFLSPYRVDIQQGNFVSQEMLAQLKVGMTMAQVQFALGTPLLNDMFHSDRWDYVFRMQKRNGEVTTSRVTVFFKDKRLARFEGGNLPDEQDYLAQIAGKPPKATEQPSAPSVPKAPSAAAKQ